MKKIIVLISIVLMLSEISFTQHQLTVQGGWTFSSLYKVASPEAWEISYYYSDLFEFTPIHLPHLGLEYDYNLPTSNWRLSTGISFLCLGSMDYFWEGTDWAYMYLTIPLLVGYQHPVSSKFSIVVEGGVEAGVTIDNVGSLIILGQSETKPYAGLVLGIEGNYKRLSFGIRGHLGLNNFNGFVFNPSKETLYFRHVGGTVYIGYTFWDSAKAKKRRAERKRRKS